MNKEILVPFQTFWIKLQGFILWTEPCRIHTVVERNPTPSPSETILGSSKEFLNHTSSKTCFVKVLFSVFNIYVMCLFIVCALTTSKRLFFTPGRIITPAVRFSSGKLSLKSIEAGILLKWNLNEGLMLWPLMTFTDFLIKNLQTFK